MRKKHWEDLNKGERLSCRTVVFERADIIDFAERYDPQPSHTDEATANASIFGGLIASSLHTLAACTRAVVEAQGNLAIMSGLGLAQPPPP